MKNSPHDVVDIRPVKYYWREWYTRVTEASGKVWHYEPLNTEWAARQLGKILALAFKQSGRMRP